MASEASSSNSGGAFTLHPLALAYMALPLSSQKSPYIGVITRAGIRYEGHFHSLDIYSGDLTLQYVKHFGTEGRKEDGPQIPPSSGLYGRICFRGSDILDLEDLASTIVPMCSLLKLDPAVIEIQLDDSEHEIRGCLFMDKISSSCCTVL